MTYKGSTPMPDIVLSDDKNWHPMPIAALHHTIQDVLVNVWKENGRFVMIKTDLGYVSICLHTRGTNCVILEFE